MKKSPQLFPAIIVIVVIVLAYFIDNTVNDHLINISQPHFYLMEGVLILLVLFAFYDVIQYYVYLYKWLAWFKRTRGTHILSGKISEFMTMAHLTHLNEKTIDRLLRYMNMYQNDNYYQLNYDPDGPLTLDFWEEGIHEPLSSFKFYAEPV